jgi:hypothetical protein
MKNLSDNLASLLDTAKGLEQTMETSGLEAVEGRRFLLRMLAEYASTYLKAG